MGKSTARVTAFAVAALFALSVNGADQRRPKLATGKSQEQVSSELRSAIWARSSARATVALSRGANPNATSWEGNSVVCDAVQYGQFEIVKLLVDFGADVNSSCKDRLTPLHLATRAYRGSLGPDHKPDLATTRFLLEHGAKINEKRSDGFTALHFAAHAGATDVIELLLDRGADINAGSTSGLSPLIVAILYQDVGL